MQVCDLIGEIIISTRAPYQKFPKRVNLVDLAALLEEVWDEDD